MFIGIERTVIAEVQSIDKTHLCHSKLTIFFLFCLTTYVVGNSLEASHRDASNEYPQQMFLMQNKKNSFSKVLIHGLEY